MKGICASRCVKSRGCSTACDSTAAIWSRVILIALSGTVVPRVPFVRIKTPGLYSLSHRSAGESRGASSARGHSSSHGFSWILIRRGVEGYMGDADSYAWRRRHRTEAAAPLNVLVFKFVRRPPPGEWYAPRMFRCATPCDSRLECTVPSPGTPALPALRRVALGFHVRRVALARARFAGNGLAAGAAGRRLALCAERRPWVVE